MLNRRQFLRRTTGSMLATGLFTHPFLSLAQSYDMIVRGGRVIDPSLHFDDISDVAIAGGRIAEVANNLAAGAAQEIDAAGKLVMPGLLDVHAHYAQDAQGPHICLSDGVTGWVDAGLGRGGSDRRGGSDCTLGATAGASADQHWSARCDSCGRYRRSGSCRCRGGEGGNRPQPGLRCRRQGAADRGGDCRRCRGAASRPGGGLLFQFAGDDSHGAIRHAHGRTRGAIETRRHRHPHVCTATECHRRWRWADFSRKFYEARRRGIWFDVANGRVDHISWDNFDTVMAAGFWPDTISTDGFSNSRSAPGVIDFPNIMSKFLNFSDMSLSDVVACGTGNASRLFSFLGDKGTLNVGAPADIAILELREGSFEFLDNYEGVRMGGQRLFPFETILAGRRVPRA